MGLKSLKIRMLLLFVIILVFQIGLSGFATFYTKGKIQQEEINKTKRLIDSNIELVQEEFNKIELVSKLANAAYEKKMDELATYPDETINQMFDQKYLMDNGLYSLDQYVEKTKADIGNARIEKGARTVAEKRAIMAAESYDGLFATIKKTIPESQWYYFTSTNKFQKIYPFVANKEGKYTTEKSMGGEFFTIASPEKNPNRELVWTKPYKDDLGTGMMVTVSNPVYVHDQFQGVFSIDVTLQSVEAIANSFASEDGTHAMVVDSFQNVLTGAATKKTEDKTKPDTIDTEIPDADIKGWMQNVVSTNKDSDELIANDKIIFASPIKITGWYLFLEMPLSSVQKISNQQMILVSALIAVLIVGMIVIFAYLSKRLTALTVVRDRLVAIASGGGDLTGRIKISGSDEIRQLADAFNEYLNKLEKMIGDIKKSAFFVVNHSNHLEKNMEISTDYIEGINQKSAELSSESTNISAVAQELSAAVEEIAATTRDNLSTLGNLVTEITQISTLSANSETVANRALHGMENIELEVNKSVGIVKQLEESMGRISDIVTTMTGISTQTNLLALNASIEAARAGEAGKGFSVVAEEVRKLAEESKRSSDNIYGIIGELQNSLTETIKTLNNQGDIILVEKQNVMSLIEHMSEIKSSIESSSEQIKTFEMNVDAQADGTDASSQNLGQVSESISEMTTALITINENLKNQADIQLEINQIAVEMKQTSENLNGLVEMFVISDDVRVEEDEKQ
ncbi:HAMP domain-containing protein [Brevibacillus fluminis]|uniref:HAMP domain-containing protein n=1 Tax=Brevibacillus fluminis TaxID=511487 RepID=A0A3M8DEB0_9BACL|nr:methyl-accepting chemotaxis protein [Brevibacillus fluminis]RNB85919.1 HAMP domain-containing protein [Brevibacillus fluminis]